MIRHVVLRALVAGWLLLLLWPHVAQAQTPTPTPPTDRSVVNVTTIAYGTFQSVLHSVQSPMAADAQAIYSAAQQAGIDPNFLLAVARRESIFATAPTWAGRKPDGTVTYNWGNVPCRGYARCYNGQRAYTSWLEATADWLQVIQTRYVARGVTSVRPIITDYAPNNQHDTEGYITDVLTWMAQWEQNQVTPPTTGGVLPLPTLDSWVIAPINDANVDAWRQVAQTWWGRNQALLQTVQSLATTRATLTPTLETFLNRLGVSLRQLALIMVVAAISVAGIAIVLAPVFATRQTLVELRAVPIMWFIAGVILPALGEMFIGFAHARESAGDAIYQGLYAVGEAAFAEDGDLPDGGIGEIPPFFPDRPQRRVIDVAAAYLLVTPDDLGGDVLLPPAFVAEFYPTTGEQLRAQPPDLRQQAIGRAYRGQDRQFTGLQLTALSVIDESISTTFFWTLFGYTLALAVVLTIAVFKPTLALLSRLGNATFQLFIWSGLVAVIQGLGTAYLFHTATIGSAGQLATAAFRLLIIEAVLLAVTLLGIVRAVWGTARAIARYQPIADAMTLTDTVYHGFHKRQTARSAASMPPMTPLRAAGAYLGARALWLERKAALAYTAAPSAMVQRSAAAALVAGKLPADVERALRIGGAKHLGQPGSFRSVVALRDSFPRAAAPPPVAAASQPAPSSSSPPPRGRSRVQPSQRAQAVQAGARARRAHTQGVAA